MDTGKWKASSELGSWRTPMSTGHLIGAPHRSNLELDWLEVWLVGLICLRILNFEACFAKQYLNRYSRPCVGLQCAYVYLRETEVGKRPVATVAHRLRSNAVQR
jgi:hypothetical protein